MKNIGQVRRVRVIFLESLVLVCACYFVIASHSQNKTSLVINEDKWLAIKNGMSREEVRHIIGDRGGAYNEFPILEKSPLTSWANSLIELYDSATWTTDEGEITVCFDDDGGVRYAFYRTVITEKRPIVLRFLHNALGL
jgi:hypothetical protein